MELGGDNKVAVPLIQSNCKRSVKFFDKLQPGVKYHTMYLRKIKYEQQVLAVPNHAPRASMVTPFFPWRQSHQCDGEDMTFKVRLDIKLKHEGLRQLDHVLSR